MARAQGARSQLAIAFESVYGTAPAGGFTRVPFASVSLGTGQPLLDSELLGYGRDPLPPVKDAITSDGDVVVPIDVEAFGFWLKAAFGQPDTSTVAGTAAAGAILFADNPMPGDTITLNGVVWTFVADDPSGPQTEVAGTLADTLTALVSDLNGSIVAGLAVATYAAADGDTLTIAFDADGAAGNAFTLAASDATPSGPALTGGVNAASTHVFRSGSYTLPSLSIEKALPEVPRFEMFSGCMVNTLSWQMERSGLLTATVGIIAQGEEAAAATQAGSPSDITLQRFGHFNGSVQRDGVALGNLVSAQITYTNNLDRIETIRSDGKIDGADPANAQLTGQMVVRFADATLLTQAINGEACELVFAYDLGGGRSLELVAHAVYLPRPRVEISGPAGVQVTFDWQAALDPAESCMAEVTLVNSVGAY